VSFRLSDWAFTGGLNGVGAEKGADAGGVMPSVGIGAAANGAGASARTTGVWNDGDSPF
jgi:hypothetical protein